jgi:hypothetical protein
MSIDPVALGEFLEESAIETASGAVIDVFDRGLMTQSGVAQPGEQALVTPITELCDLATGRAIQDASALAPPSPHTFG